MQDGPAAALCATGMGPENAEDVAAKWDIVKQQTSHIFPMFVLHYEKKPVAVRGNARWNDLFQNADFPAQVLAADPDARKHQVGGQFLTAR